jgi:phosphate transport system substrate-binding protein
VKQLPNSIGYVELAYAKQNKLAYADIRNAKGEFVSPTIAAVTAAAAGAAAKLPANTDYRISIVNASGKGAYPISSFTWLLVYRNQTDATKGKKLLDFVKWALTDGEKSAATLDYAPLPAAMAKQLIKQLGSVSLAAK